ncbi:MAG: formyltransferase family protein [Candidatus Daviesbacteria bacterium]|nr:formyltransferase family protein [Candidatus Daviesbacteria bacterium]
MKEFEKPIIALLIGGGSRVPALLQYLDKNPDLAEISMVVSHKALKNGEDVIGIAESKKRGIPTAYFNLIQMRNSAKEVNPDLKDDDFRKEYFQILGSFLTQKYPQRPSAVFMLGWDLVVSKEFLKFFPFVFNLHPAQLGENSGDETVKLESGKEIPVLQGEHDEVITRAIELKLPRLGSCIHLAVPIADAGGLVVKRVEVSIKEGETLESYEKKLLPAEEQLVIDTFSLFAKGKIKLVDGQIRII